MSTSIPTSELETLDLTTGVAVIPHGAQFLQHVIVWTGNTGTIQVGLTEAADGTGTVLPVPNSSSTDASGVIPVTMIAPPGGALVVTGPTSGVTIKAYGFDSEPRTALGG